MCREECNSDRIAPEVLSSSPDSTISLTSQIAQSENKELFDNALEKRVKGWFRTNSRKNDPVPAWRRTHELNPVGLWDLGRKFFNSWWSTKTRKQMILLANRRKISSSLTLCHNAYVIHLISSRHVNILSSPIITGRGDELFTALRPGRKKSGRRMKERLHEMKAQADWRCHLLEDNSILFITTSLFMFVELTYVMSGQTSLCDLLSSFCIIPLWSISQGRPSQRGRMKDRNTRQKLRGATRRNVSCVGSYAKRQEDMSAFLIYQSVLFQRAGTVPGFLQPCRRTLLNDMKKEIVDSIWEIGLYGK
ncbi:uncharacterized protein LOC123385663 [Felis catus]|uniref:uncharacterized protein LOC123385663 n=1 Tax=Felis catus TaxID=9685 RepID=UPI001D1A0E49|nr:uncharacterized protein LOC123385663 [Felis catus]XP_044914460.1 uncharacterized protein LOC123385663 [Felis catus]